MSLWEAIVLGVVEGITEYLPVSSTGHLILASALLGLDEPATRKAAVDAFNIVIQGGAVLAVLGLYWPRVRRMIAGAMGRDPAGLRLLGLLGVAFLPAVVLGPLLEDTIERRLFNPPAVVLALALWGAVMIGIGPWQRRRGEAHPTVAEPEDLTWGAALLIGALQCLAMWPGTSRSMITIVAGMLVGMRPRQAAEFSFLLALPTLGGACVFRLAGDVAGSGPSMLAQLGLAPVVVGVGVAAAAAALAVKWLVHYLNRHGLAVFGWYRLALSAVFVVLFASGWLAIGPPVPSP
ncbi:MAG: undecaprenyl-diphosphate phosphatase [Longimicrobiales bacterium]|nr:undecaprenyl-diphosphate phosphatase [Longimicrobiales bacterium]